MVPSYPSLQELDRRRTTGWPGRALSCPSCLGLPGWSEEQVPPLPSARSPCSAQCRGFGVPRSGTVAISGGTANLRRPFQSRRGLPTRTCLRRCGRLDDGRPRLFVTADLEGRTARMSLNDARDAAARIVLALDSEDAVGKAFNGGPAGSTTMPSCSPTSGSGWTCPSSSRVRPERGRSGWCRVNEPAAFWLPAHGTVFEMVDEAPAGRGA